MKLIKQSLALLALTGLFACAQTPERNLSPRMHEPDSGVMVVAHRGCWAHAPENSIAAIDDCIEMGVDVVEIDLRLTADGQIILMHDRTLKRTTETDRAVSELGVDELAQLQLRQGEGGEGAALTAERIPTLRDVLAHVDGRVVLDLDIKSDIEEMAPLLLADLRAENACGETLVPIVASAGEITGPIADLIECAGYMPNLRPHMGPMRTVIESYRDLQPVAVAVRFSDWAELEAGASAAGEIGARLWVNTLSAHHAAGLVDADALEDPDALWGRLHANGVNMIQTDEPAALIAYLRQQGLR